MPPRGGALGFSPRLIRYYLPQTLAEANFSGGICRDVPPTSIPPGFCYDSLDFNLDKPGLAYYRGPIKLFGQSFGDGSKAASWISVPKLDGTQYMFVGWNGQIIQVDPAGGTNSVLASNNWIPIDRPKVYPNPPDYLIINHFDGLTRPAKIRMSGGSLVFQALGGAPPPSSLSAIHHGFLVLAGDKAHPNRLYFSPSTSVEDSWSDVSGNYPSFWDTSYPITALASVQGVLLVFSENFCERLIGDIPPNNVGENFSLQALGATGCTSPLSIQPWGANIIFANPKGIYVSNGAGFDSLTDKANGTGISRYWQSLLPGTNSGMVGAIYNQKFYILSLNRGQYNLVCYLPSKAWWRFSTLSMIFSDSTPDIFGQDEVYHVGGYAGHGDSVAICSPMFSPVGKGTDDVADPYAPRPPQLITRMVGDGLGLKAYEHGHVTLSNPGNVSLSYIKGVGQESIGSGTGFLTLESPLTTSAPAATLHFQRRRFTVNTDAQGMYFVLSPYASGPLTELQVLAIEAEVRNATYGNWADALYP